MLNKKPHFLTFTINHYRNYYCFVFILHNFIALITELKKNLLTRNLKF